MYRICIAMKLNRHYLPPPGYGDIGVHDGFYFSWMTLIYNLIENHHQYKIRKEIIQWTSLVFPVYILVPNQKILSVFRMTDVAKHSM